MATFNNKVVGTFNDRSAVNLLIEDLKGLGYDKADFSILAKNLETNNDKEPKKEFVPYPMDETETDSSIGVESRLSDHGKDMVGSPKEQGLLDDNHFYKRPDLSEKPSSNIIKNVAAGSAVGLIAGIGLLMIPGIGPILAAGSLLTTLTAGAAGAAIGATAGSLISFFKTEGIPSDRAELYINHFDKGDVLVFVRSENEKKGQLIEIFTKHKVGTLDTF